MTFNPHHALLALASLLAVTAPHACRAAVDQSATAVGPAVLTNCFTNKELFGFETAFAAEVTNGLNYTQMGSFPTQVRQQGVEHCMLRTAQVRSSQAAGRPQCLARLSALQPPPAYHAPPALRTTTKRTSWQCQQRRPCHGCPRQGPQCTR